MQVAAKPESDERRSERLIVALCGAAAVLLGIVGLAGWVLGLPALTRIAPGYKAIAPTVAVSLIVMGLALPRLAAGSAGRGVRVLLAVITGLIALFGLLDVLGFLVGADLNLEEALTVYATRVSAIPFELMSPVAGMLLFLTGGAMVAIALAPAANVRSRLGDVAGGLGLLASLIALVFALGYLYGAPLLYGGPAVPIAMIATAGGLVLAVGAVVAAGRRQWPLRALAGDSTRAGLVRAFVPLTVFVALTVSVADHQLDALLHLNHVLVAAVLGVTYAVVAGLVASRVAKSIGETIDRALLEQLQAEEALREAKSALEVRVQERTAELEQASLAVQAERKRFNDVLETLPAYLVLLTPDYHVAYANRFFRERFGESHGRRCFEYLFGRAEPCEICETYKCLVTMAPLQWEWTGPDGLNYSVHDFPFTDTDGSTLILEMGIDVTELKQAEAELRRHQEHLEELVEERTTELGKQRALLEAILANTDTHLVYLDRDFNFVWVNAAYARACRRSREEFVGRNHFEFYPHPENEAIFRRVRETGVPARYIEKPFEHPDTPDRGTTYWDWTLTPMKNEQGEVQSFIFSLADVTERVRARQHLLEAERAQTQMAEMVALEINHRMKNNLMLVSGILELQLNALPARSDAAQALRQAKARISALSTVHEQIYEQRSEGVELGDALRRIAEMSVGALAASEVDLSVRAESIRISSRAASTLATVSNELITNALKHGGPGPDGRRRVDVALSREGAKVRLRVWNSGNPLPPGFDMEKQQGLGLRLCQELVRGELQGSFGLWAQDGGTLSEAVVDENAIDATRTGA